uniref:Stimulator of interferon genes protein n=1 Tax=Myripristis murdjan TaxID=586833 RepID=A0A667ZVH2_9TELE
MCGPAIEALVPRPRGNLPKVCASLLAAIATSSFVLLSPERLCGVVAMVILVLTLGPLLHGLCLLAEEMFNHVHRCPVFFLDTSKGNCRLLRRGEVLLHDLAVFVVGVQGPSEVEVSDICEGRKMNVAHGLAWSFYLGYLRLVLPRLENSIVAFRASHQAGCFQGRSSRKLLILIPLNANIAHKLEDEDDNIRFYDNLPNSEIDRAGVRGRVYKHSVYNIFDENGKGHQCVAEYATPLLTLYNMSQESSAGFGEPERRQQVLLFYRTLRDILEQSLECRNRYRLILLNDDHEEDPHFLSKAILRHLQQQEKEEFCLTAHPQQEMECTFARPLSTIPRREYWQHTEPMSREPTLMMSLEPPQPLREAVEITDHYQATA